MSNEYQNADVSELDSSELLEVIRSEGTYRWTTEDYHGDNIVTMGEFLSDHLPENVEVYLQDGTYAEIRLDDVNYEVHAFGDGDPWNHKIEFFIL